MGISIDGRILLWSYHKCGLCHKQVVRVRADTRALTWKAPCQYGPTTWVGRLRCGGRPSDDNGTNSCPARGIATPPFCPIQDEQVVESERVAVVGNGVITPRVRSSPEPLPSESSATTMPVRPYSTGGWKL